MNGVIGWPSMHFLWWSAYNTAFSVIWILVYKNNTDL